MYTSQMTFFRMPFVYRILFYICIAYHMIRFSGLSDETLKVGSFSFECIMILLIYFINCQKVLFTRKRVSFSKKVQS